MAVDLDPQALIATRENAIRNGVSSQIETQAVPAALRPAIASSPISSPDH